MGNVLLIFIIGIILFLSTEIFEPNDRFKIDYYKSLFNKFKNAKKKKVTKKVENRIK